METTVSVVPAAVTPAGSAPKVSRTESPSSSMVSWTAVNVKVASVRPALKVTSAGTPL